MKHSAAIDEGALRSCAAKTLAAGPNLVTVVDEAER